MDKLSRTFSLDNKIYYKKYLKYKSKYIKLRDQYKMDGGGKITAIYFFENKNLEHNTLIKGLQIGEFVQYNTMKLVGPISSLQIPGIRFYLMDSNKKVTQVNLKIMRLDTNNEINRKIREQPRLNNYRYLILEYDKPAPPLGQILNMKILYIDPLLKN